MFCRRLYDADILMVAAVFTGAKILAPDAVVSPRSCTVAPVPNGDMSDGFLVLVTRGSMVRTGV